MKLKLWPSLIIISATVILLRLGFWQLERAEQKQAALALLTKQQDLSSEEWLLVDDFRSIHSRRVQLEGRVADKHIWLLDNKVYQGRVGYSVVSKFILKGTERAVLVDWGWIQAPVSREQLPRIELPTTAMLLHGLVKTTDFSQIVLKQAKETGWPRRIQSLQELDLSMGIIYADSDSVSGLVQIYKPVVMPPEKHQAYALQWFLLALACVSIFVFASRNRGTKDEN